MLVVALKNHPEVPPTVWFLYPVAETAEDMVMNRTSAVRYGAIGGGDRLVICERSRCDLCR